ncbi:MAG: hypothetical protein QM790_05390 [Nibricoccus sp.]
MGWLGYYDSWLALGLVIVAFSGTRWLVWISCLLTPWVDERFVAALPLALFCRWLFFRQQEPDALFVRWIRREAIVPIVLSIAFVLLRLVFLPGFSAAEATVGGFVKILSKLDFSASRIALGIREGLRAGWIFVVAVFFLVRGERSAKGLLLISITVIVAVGLYSAQDYSRSMTMVLPVAVLGLVTLLREQLRLRIVGLSSTCAIAAFTPAYHVMSDAVQPIRSLSREIQNFRSPPSVAQASTYEEDGVRAFRSGDYPKAEFDFTVAMKLADNPAWAARQRGDLYAAAHRWSAAFDDYSTAVAHDSKNPDSWFKRAQANFALSRLAEAKEDFATAFAVGSKDWCGRPEVTQFLVQLNNSAPRK